MLELIFQFKYLKTQLIVFDNLKYLEISNATNQNVKTKLTEKIEKI
jgi:hypothetical protein